MTMKDHLVGAHLVLGCQIIACDAVESIDLADSVDGEMTGYAAVGLAETIRDEWPEGWGWDMSGVNRVLHCPEHRTS